VELIRVFMMRISISKKLENMEFIRVFIMRISISNKMKMWN